KVTFAAPSPSLAAQTLSFSLTAADSCNLVDRTTVNVIVKHNNQAPVAMIGGGNVTVKEGAIVTLDGSVSYDPDGDSITYAWTQLSGTAVTLVGANTAKPSFTAPNLFPDGNPALSTTLTFQLTVTDQPP